MTIPLNLKTLAYTSRLKNLGFKISISSSALALLENLKTTIKYQISPNITKINSINFSVFFKNLIFLKSYGPIMHFSSAKNLRIE
ncbi:hypothetical protein BpHYR1_026852 [Brachionus plicatilis]|uniref:Uncharacterized protein n=1 Tax=Brachionus plicatilis TaxID=10195 RepID=A0A3M7S6U6_BRAPC|nr:hypothetical protein BpHYR1_026852 [Brachionus plicatilis]